MRSLCTPARTRRGSGGATTLSADGSAGLSASGSCPAITLAAPILVSTWTEPGEVSAELALRGALRDDHGAQQRRLALDAVDRIPITT